MSTTDSAQTTIERPARGDAASGAGRSGHPAEQWRWFYLGLLLAILPLLIPYFTGMWALERYRYFPFAIAAVVALAWNRSDGEFYPPRGWISWAAIAIGLFLVVAGAVLQFTWFAAVALVLIAGAMLYAMRGPEDRTLVALVLPLMTVVQPIRADVLLVQYLQGITTWMSSVLLDAMAVPHAVANNVIQLSDRELFVAEACSGIQSVFTLGFLACLLIVWRRRRLWMTPIYLVIACLLAVFANVIRVTIVALASTWYDADLASGWPHDLLGYIALACAGAFLISFDHLIVTVFHRVPQDDELNPIIALWNTLSLSSHEGQHGGRGVQQRDLNEVQRWDRSSPTYAWSQRALANGTVRYGFAGVVGIVCALSLFQVLVSRKPPELIRSEKALVFDPPEDLLEPSLNVLTVVDHVANRGYENPRLGANSDIWECQWGDVVAQFVISQPHQGWHELCDCYQRLEWNLLDRDVRTPESLEQVAPLAMETRHPDALRSSYVMARFKREPVHIGYLIFAGIGSDGTLLDAPDSFSAFTHRVWNRIDTTGVWDQTEVIMLQMWLTSPTKLTPRKLKELEREFIAVRAQVADAIRVNAGRELPKQATRSIAPPSGDADRKGGRFVPGSVVIPSGTER
ncbi:exosortase U [Roseiconus nitratireducens]|uniref:Exosortase U n=1 Tax=Roseiconus nitratireducens TaxID=2605748 RepID=A0A5M6CXN4_9BACT|nr:exosortase U [Roseiconus nitratireducens]KAA5539863.1 exosortase U [Roseiconus nitratireducens]